MEMVLSLKLDINGDKFDMEILNTSKSMGYRSASPLPFIYNNGNQPERATQKYGPISVFGHTFQGQTVTSCHNP